MTNKIGKVKCRVCDNEDNGFCIVKQCAVKTNKARHCKEFVMDANKVQVKVKPLSTLRPEWYWNRKKALKEFRKQEQEQSNRQAESSSGVTPDILANFRSSATNTD